MAVASGSLPFARGNGGVVWRYHFGGGNGCVAWRYHLSARYHACGLLRRGGQRGVGEGRGGSAWLKTVLISRGRAQLSTNGRLWRTAAATFRGSQETSTHLWRAGGRATAAPQKNEHCTGSRHDGTDLPLMICSVLYIIPRNITQHLHRGK